MRKIAYVVWLANGGNPFCRVTYTDGDIRIVRKGEPGYSRLRSIAVRKAVQKRSTHA